MSFSPSHVPTSAPSPTASSRASATTPRVEHSPASHAASAEFGSLALSALLLRAIRDEGYTVPTPIQLQTIPPALAGRDLLGCAQTGTGKTAAFALPILERLLRNTAPAGNSKSTERRAVVKPRALILSPTRELAVQIGESFATYGRHTPARHVVIFGGVSQVHQVESLRRGVEIIVATPGRLLDLMQQQRVDLGAVEVFVLDEADRMLDMGFIDPIRRIASRLPQARQTMMFSATMPREIMHLADSLLRNPVKVAVTPVASAAPLIEQSVYMVARQRKQALLEALIQNASIERALVFTRTKHGADKVAQRLLRSGINSIAIHGNKAQNQRQRALDSFRAGRVRVLVATDVAARGLDVDGISHVFNFDLPNEPEAYVHRIGRTGRAGATGLAIAFCDPEERTQLRDIERLTGIRIPVVSELPAMDESPRSEAPAATSQPGRRYASSSSNPSGGTRGSRTARSRPAADRAARSEPRPASPASEGSSGASPFAGFGGAGSGRVTQSGPRTPGGSDHRGRRPAGGGSVRR